jgi:hypothetical protein
LVGAEEVVDGGAAELEAFHDLGDGEEFGAGGHAMPPPGQHRSVDQWGDRPGDRRGHRSAPSVGFGSELLGSGLPLRGQEAGELGEFGEEAGSGALPVGGDQRLVQVVGMCGEVVVAAVRSPELLARSLAGCPPVC